MLLTRDLSHGKNRDRLSIKGWKKVFQANGPYKQAGVAMDKVDFRLKSVRRNNETQFILIKRTIHQEEISILNIYTPNIGAPDYIKKKKTLVNLRAQIDINTVIVGGLNTP
jgi:hypothetical protein